MRYLPILVWILLCLQVYFIKSQTLERKVSISYQNVRLATILKDIKNRYGVSFSYANSVIPLDKKISLTVNEKSLQQALMLLFKEAEVGYQMIDEQVVLYKKPEKPLKSKGNTKPGNPKKSKANEKGPKPQADSTNLSDLVNPAETTSLLPFPNLNEESETGEKKTKLDLQADFITEKRNLKKNYVAQLDAAIENNDDSMALDLKKDFKAFGKKLKAQFKNLSKRAKHIRWNAKPGESLLPPDSGTETEIPQTINEKRMVVHSDSTHKPITTHPLQFGLVPPISSNGKANVLSVNHLSFNLLAGLAGGLRGVEVGGVANLEKKDVHGVQVAGICNLVKKDVSGIQVAGVLNANKGQLEGTQISGFANLSKSESSSALQVAGFLNLHKGDLLGMQTAGFMNINGGYMVGPQLAGFINISKGPFSGVQAAGFMNTLRGNLSGLQLAGFMNLVSKNSYGTQLAGFANITSKNHTGVQISGFLNQGKIIRGSQIGFFNIADTVEGIQLGFINISRKGYRRLEAFYMERLHVNLAFKMGSQQFYNIFSAGYNPADKRPIYSYGYGFGSEINLSKHSVLNLELVCNRVFEDKKMYTDNLNLLNQFKINIGIKPGKRTALFGGPTLNVAVTQMMEKETGLIGASFIPKETIYNKTEGKTRVAIWPGLHAGIRF